MKRAVATTRGTIGTTMASGLARTRGRPRAQHLSALQPAPGNLGRDRIGRAKRHIAPALEPLERIGQRPGGTIVVEGLVEAHELRRSTGGCEHIDRLTSRARLACHVD